MVEKVVDNPVDATAGRGEIRRAPADAVTPASMTE
jgi:hypothetical protein